MTDAGTMKASIFRWFVTSAADVTIPGIGILKYDGWGTQRLRNMMLSAMFRQVQDTTTMKSALYGLRPRALRRKHNTK